MNRQVISVLQYLICCWAVSATAAWSGETTSDKELRQALPPAAKIEIDFFKHIQPILQAKCTSCHGDEEQEGGLRLDIAKKALEGGDSGKAIVVGKSLESPLLLRVARLGDDDPMPPEGEGTPLTPEQLALVRAWIDRGAPWPDRGDSALASTKSDHWAYRPIRHPKVPRVKHQPWVLNEIDSFILHQLEQEQVAPSPLADRARQIRRLYLDLWGLQPSPEQWAKWMGDEGSDWYQRLVEELLGSPHYGERWARHWLDVARYADSDGYEKDQARPHAWRWRTWVIHALNGDMPFDQFTIEQLAGDLLPQATLEQRVATGFHRNTLINREGGTDPEEDRVKRTIDRTNTLGDVWLGMTLECGQCHSHKYDPLSQREYFGLYAFFDSMVEPDIGAPLGEQIAAYRQEKEVFDSEHQQFVAAIATYERDKLPGSLKAWEKSSPNVTPVWSILRPERVQSELGTSLDVLEDGSVLASGENPGRAEVYSLVCRTELKGITGIRLEAISDKRLPGGGPGRSPEGDFSLAMFDVTAEPVDGSAEAQQVELTGAKADFSAAGHGVERAINNDFSSGWAISPRIGESHVATFETRQPVGFEGGTKLEITMRQSSTLMLYHNLGRFRISLTTREKPLPLYGVTDTLAATLELAPDDRTEMQQQDLLNYYRMVDPTLVELRDAAAKHDEKAPKSPYQETKAQVVAEMEQPRATHLHIRGDFLQPGDEVGRSTPEVLNPLTPRSKHADRLDLARWLVDPANPLTARVTVNRIWSCYFGRGIVPSIKDFGTQGEAPSHPELLDWLATYFRDNGWSQKNLHRLIVNSATYRQSSDGRPDVAQRDPYNARLSHQNRLRVEAEIVRDLALTSGGLIKHRIGGPSVRPRQPEGLAMLGYANSVKWVNSKGDDQYRRGMYTFFQRTVPYPMLMAFDAPDSNLACTKRERSNTPLQALTIWNDPSFFECAQGLGRRIVAEVPASQEPQQTVHRRIRRAFQICLSREPSQEDLAVVSQLVATLGQQIESDPEAAAQLTGREDMEAREAVELATWILVGRTVMNLDEFITRG